VASQKYQVSSPPCLQSPITRRNIAAVRPNKRLTEAQEQAIYDYIKRLNAKNMSLTLKLVPGVANYLLGEEVDPVGPDWGKRYIERHPELKRRRRRQYSVDRQRP